MRAVLLTFGSLFILLGAAFHVYVFTLESISWRKPKTWKTFGLLSQDHAEIIASMAFNQGFYNLYLGMGAIVGLIALAFNQTIGFTLMLFTAMSMFGAGVVLYFSVQKSRRAAIFQAGPPLLGIVCLIAGLAL